MNFRLTDNAIGSEDRRKLNYYGIGADDQAAGGDRGGMINPAGAPETVSQRETSHEEVDAAELLLIVDDERALRELETEILRFGGYKILQAESAEEALRLAEAAPVDLLLTDFFMPKVDGLELARRFRAAYPKTPVLMVSGSLALMPAPTVDLSPFDVLPKPFLVSELLHKVRTMLDAAVPPPLPRP